MESKGKKEKLLKTGIHGCLFVGSSTQLRSQTKALKEKVQPKVEKKLKPN